MKEFRAEMKKKLFPKCMQATWLIIKFSSHVCNLPRAKGWIFNQRHLVTEIGINWSNKRVSLDKCKMKSCCGKLVVALRVVDQKLKSSGEIFNFFWRKKKFHTHNLAFKKKLVDGIWRCSGKESFFFTIRNWKVF